MKINKINYFLLIFIYFLNNYNILISSAATTTSIINNVFQIEEFTENRITDSYPIESDLSYCTFQFDFLATCINDNGNNSYPDITGEVDSVVFGVYPSIMVNNSTSSIYKLTLNVNTSPSRITKNFTLAGCGYTGTETPIYQLSFQCHEVNITSLKIEMTEVYYGNIHGYHSYVKITGLLYPLKLNIFTYTELGGGYYLFLFPGYNGYGYTADYYNSYIIGNISVSFKIGDQDIVLTTPPYQGLSIINQASDYRNYPSNLNDTHVFNQNYKCSPIVTFKIKTSIYPPIIFGVNQAKSVNSYSNLVMYGESDGSLVYYQNPDNSYTGNMEIYYFIQKGDHFESFSNVSFTSNEYIYYSSKFSINLLGVGNLLVLNIFQSDTNYEFLPFSVSSSKISMMVSFPFGFESGNLDGFNYESNLLYSNHSLAVSYGFYHGVINFFSNIVPPISNSKPVIKDIQIKYALDNFYSIVIQASSENGISEIKVGDIIFGFETLVDGTIYDGTFQCILSTVLSSISTIYITDTNQNQLQFSASNYYSINPIKYYNGVPNNRFSIDSISSITLDSYEMDITDTDSYNTMYFDFFGKKFKSPFYLLLLGEGKVLSFFPARWDDVKKVHYIKFKLLKNGFPSKYLDWYLATSDSLAILGSALNKKFNQLCQIKNLTPDLSGPFVTNIVKIPDSGIADLNIDPLQAVGWNITIEDKVNSFSHGFIVAQGLVDGSIYNFTLNSNNSEKSITFTLLLSNISCIDQDFQINQIELYDTNKMISGYDFTTENYYTFNALMNYNNELDILRISIACKPLIIDTSGPELISITPNRTSIDVGSNDRSISFTLIVRDSDSGINIGQSPIVYINSDSFNTLECKSKLISCDNSDEKQCTFKCDIELPFAFTYSHQFIYQVYGIWNKNGLFSGYSYNKLYSLGIDSVIKTSFSINHPIIIRTNIVTNEPNSEILIIGRSIGNATSINIKYHDGTNESLIPICESQSYCIITIKGTNESFTIQIQLKDKSLSNIYKITPFIVGKFEYINSGSTNSISSSSSSSSSSTEITCPGQPVCGGTSNGYCTSKGCICISPWYGIECKQKIIIVPQPSFNNTDPNITVILPNENNNNQIEFTSLTSIIALRELDINNKVNQTHTFSKWYNNQINSTLNEYYSNFSNINNSDKTTQIKVTIQWFNNQTNITFADNELIMNPNSIKYTIEIKDYPFKSKLNSLEIVMSALFKSDKINSCSNKEFGESNGYDDSNYLKLQVNDHSLYARFIKRGIIDNNKIVSVSNRLLDSSFSTINEASTTQSYIGISIQHFENIAIVDPDFSIMLDFSKSSNSICKSTKLTSTQIAGIIIGCFGFAVVIAISFIVYYIKKKRNAREMKNLSNKLKNLS